jgi:HTH-type transcriptional regulator / antitoxin HigA
MTELHAPFTPDWVSPPGDTILDLIEERGWTQAELAKRLGYTEKHTSQLINGKPLTVDAAFRLERVLSSNVEFWLAREANYRKHLARIDAEQTYRGWAPWLDELPVKELMANSSIPKTRIDAKNKPTLVEACLRFFGVASPDDWRTHYCGMQADFKRSRIEQSDIGAISAWLRLGEQQAEKLDGLKYDKARFEKNLKTIRALTSDLPEIFGPQLRNLLQDAGVALILVPSIPRAHVSGVARWLSPTRPVIQLSLYGKTNDKFWFTFFHEAAHILLHSNTKEEKKAVFLDDPHTSYSDDPKEYEANEWASSYLIPSEHKTELSTLRSKVAVENFAHKIGIHSGIVVGRLQHDGVIEPSWMNDLKQSFRLSP